MKKLFTILTVLTMATTFVFAGGSKETSTPNNVEMTNYTFGGSSTVAPIANAAIAGFEIQNAGVKVTYETTGSSVGIKNLLSGTFSLAGSSRELKNDEVTSGAYKTKIALDGITVAVNKSVSISNLSMKQLANIFAGNITNWKEVGGDDMPIELVVRDETSGTYGSFTEIVIQDTLGKDATQAKKAIVAKENGEVATKIASTPGAIGYIGMGFASIVTDKSGKELSIDNELPTINNVLDKKYPISRALYVVTMNAPKEGTIEKAFIDYLLSTAGQDMVAEKQFIPVN
ncbi:MAG: phosphate ABC transporter substrate-binding protein [Spirochaetaceae bacterium]|nr:phosphate ABC transporter substrate-binding protein [Spirochaetaceae bacterium]